MVEINSNESLPKIFGHDPLKLLAEEASPKLIHDWIDVLYEAEYNPGDRRLFWLIYTVAAIAEHTNTYPLNVEYEQKFIAVCQAAEGAGELELERLRNLPEDSQDQSS
ncbi:MAG: hypothetical protein AAGA83_14730 [Cyanobacteria bacterium P01_F01_bin.116]